MKIYSSEVSGSLKVRGDIFAENYIVKSTVSTITQSFSSGSTIFGDSTDDTHRFTGSMGILHAGSNESQTGLLIKNSAGSGNSSARLLLQGNGGDNGTLGTIASRNTNASYDDVDYARIKFALPGSSMTTHGIEFHTGDGGAATKKFEIHGTKISGSSSSTGSFGSLVVADKVQGNLRVGNTNEVLYFGPDNNYIGDVGSYLKLRVADGHYFTIQNDSDVERFRLADNGKVTFTASTGIELVNTGNNTVFHIPASSAYQIGTQGSKPMIFYTNNTEAGRFDTSQNFLMGLTSAVTDDIGHVTPKIQVEGTDKNSAISILTPRL